MLTAAADMGYDSNIFTRSPAVDDYFTTLSAELDYTSQRTYYTIGAGLELTQGFFFENDNVNYTDFSWNFNFSPTDIFGGRRFSIATNFSYQLETDSDPAAGGRVKQDIYGASGRLRYALRRDLSASANVSYNRSDPRAVDPIVNPFTGQLQPVITNTRETLRFGIGVDYQQNKFLTFSVDASGGRDLVDLENNLADSDRFELDFGVRGRLLPKLNGSLAVGMDIRQEDEGDVGTEISPSYAAALEWEINELTSLTIRGQRELQPSIIGANSASTVFGGTVSRIITKRIRANASAQIQLTNFSESVVEREDDRYNFSVGGSYVLTQDISLRSSLSYQDQNSNSRDNDFTRYVISFSAVGAW